MIDEIELAARYSLVPNSFGYCGGNDFVKVFKRYLEGRANRNEIIFELKKFKGLYSYLKAIARVNKRNPFDRHVIEAFWIGNSLLKNVTAKDIKRLILEDFHKKAGMGEERAIRAANNLPKGILLHHNFNSLYLHFVGNEVARTTKNFDKCRIGWGTVISIGKQYCVLEYRPLKKGRNYFLGKPVKRRFNRYVSGILLESDLDIGDIVSTHWGAVVQRLNKQDLFKLIYSNKQVINSINK